MIKCLVAVATLWTAALVSAAPVGSIKGYIQDPSGASVMNASVELKNELTNQTQKTTSDASGLYQFLHLPPGTYSVSVQTAGFRSESVRAVEVLVDQIVSLDIKLSVGAVNEVVDVNGSALPLIEPEKSSTGATFDLKLMANLPQVNRRFNDLALLTPGATFSAPGSQVNGFAAAGSRAQSTNWMLDGVNAL